MAGSNDKGHQLVLSSSNNVKGFTVANSNNFPGAFYGSSLTNSGVAGVGYVVGRRSSPTGVRDLPSMLRTVTGGRIWAPVTLPVFRIFSSGSLRGVASFGTSVVAVGYKTTIFGSFAPLLYYSTNSGASFSVGSPAGAASGSTLPVLYDVSMASAKVAYACGARSRPGKSAVGIDIARIK